MKNLFLCCFFFLVSYFSFATPPLPNKYALVANEASSLIIEASVSKRDTINVSEEESYLLFTLDVIHVFKDKLGKTTKTAHILMKRNLDWETDFLRSEYDNPRYLRIGDRNCFFLRSSTFVLKNIPNSTPYYQLYDRYTDSRVFFTGSIHDDFKATGFDLGFVTLQDFYVFMKALPGNTVSDSLIKASQFRLEKPNEPFKDSVVIRIIEKNKRERAEYQRLHAPAQEKLLEEKVRKAQKKTTNQRLEEVVTLNVELSSPTFAYYANSTAIEFDVLLSASKSCYLDNFLMRLKYNPYAFGPNIVQGGLVTITKYPPFSTAYYNDPNASSKDYTSSVMSIPVNLRDYTTSPVTRALVGTSPSKFLKISILVQDCSQQSNIELTDGIIVKDLNFYATTNPTSYLNGVGFDNTNYSTNNISPAQLCKPNITNVSPTTVTAGTNSKITITGFGFGTTKGKGAVIFQNANTTTKSKIIVNDNVDVSSWSDTKIEYIVPSAVFAASIQSTSGTGQISVSENTGKESESSNEIIAVPYAIINIYNTGDARKYPVIHTETPNGTLGKITFYLTEELRQNTAYYNLVRQAVNDIVCATSVNFEISAITVPNFRTGLLKDGTAIISLADDNLFREDALMTTLRHTTEYCTKGTQKWFVSSESDIIIKRSVNWSTTQPNQVLPKDQHDFYNAILHELGHAAGLDHVVSSTELMRPGLSVGERASATRFIYDNFPNDNSKKGVAWLLAEGDKYDNVGSSCQIYKKMAPKKSCTIVTNIEDELSADDFALLNNPVTSEEAIVRVGTNYQNTVFNYELFTLQGQSVSKGTVLANTSMVIPLQGLQPNLYFVVLTSVYGQNHTFKMLMQ